ncbi:MAG: transcriptional regulator [Hyphomicrobiales bacterium]|nr:MAG: transcriptional regulator [Hyphomicrobiales bacterium]
MPQGRSIRWRSLEHEGLEQLRLDAYAEGIKVRSAIVGAADEVRHGVLYELNLTPDWRFQTLLVQRTDGAMMVLRRGDDGVWFDMQGDTLPDLEGCFDIDFEMTPFTNTLPIRRDPLHIGQTRRYWMAYIPADTLEPFAAEQIYTRLGEDLYRFETADGSFSADITVDADGLVVDYPDLFERVE